MGERGAGPRSRRRPPFRTASGRHPFALTSLAIAVGEATTMIRRWRAAILAPNATIGQIRSLVSETRPWYDDIYQG